MDKKKLTDDEIVKALDICYTFKGCTNECPYFNKNGRNFCMEDKALYKDLKNLINRQNAEIERLTEEKTNISQSYIEVCDINAKLTEENGQLKGYNSGLEYELELKQKQVNELTKENERLSDLEFTQEHCDLYKENEYLKSCLVLARKQAVKDTAREILDEIGKISVDTTMHTQTLMFVWEKLKEIAKRKGVEVE